MKEKNKFNRLRVVFFFLLSGVIHIAIFIYLFTQHYNESLNKIAMTKNTQKILVDLTDPRDDIVDPDSQVVSRYNYAGKGKLAPGEGQHLPGHFNPKTQNEQSSIVSPAVNQSSQSDSKSRSRRFISERGSVVVKPNTPKPQKENIKVNGVQKNQTKANQEQQHLSVDTEDTLENKFWFDEANFLQINARIHPDAEFSLELANMLKKRFATYVLGGGAINFFHVKRDQASALAKIDRQGRISFEQIISPSETQPYLNYLVSRVISNPGVITNLPKELRSQNEKGVEELTFLFNISFTGEPLRKWWMGFDFYSPKNNQR